MQNELREINDRVTEMMKIARQAGDDQLTETLWEASVLLRRARNRVDKVTSSASFMSLATKGR